MGSSLHEKIRQTGLLFTTACAGVVGLLMIFVLLLFSVFLCTVSLAPEPRKFTCSLSEIRGKQTRLLSIPRPCALRRNTSNFGSMSLLANIKRDPCKIPSAVQAITVRHPVVFGVCHTSPSQSRLLQSVHMIDVDIYDGNVNVSCDITYSRECALKVKIPLKT